jgi:hypothetical protein
MTMKYLLDRKDAERCGRTPNMKMKRQKRERFVVAVVRD